jgi:uncharacterized protein involved in exopolysaccharide biosynthesis
MELGIDDGVCPELKAQGLPEHEMNFLDMLNIVWKRRKFISYCTFGTSILAVIVLLFIPNEYTATTLLMPPAQSSSSGAALLSQLSSAGSLASVAGAGLGIKNPGDMYVSLLHSRTVEDAVIQRFGLSERYHKKILSDARVALGEHSKVTYGVKDGLITLSVTDRDPKRAAEIANGYFDEFRKFSADLAITEASQRRIFFQQQLQKANEDLSTAEESLKGTEQSTGILQMDGQTRSLIESAAALRAQVAAKEVQLQGMRTYATEDNPELLQAEQQLAALRDQLAKFGGTDQGSGLIVPKGKVPEDALEYIRKVRDVKYYEVISELMAKQFEMAKLDEARQGATIQVVDLAVAPDQKSSPKRTLIVFIVLLLSLFLSSGWCLLSVAQQKLRKGNGVAYQERTLQS